MVLTQQQSNRKSEGGDYSEAQVFLSQEIVLSLFLSHRAAFGILVP